jgi:hypothetical protein
MTTQTTKEKIELMSEAQWAELSLRETLSAEEAMCDVADLKFIAETADLPKSDADLAGFIGGASGEFDKYQFFNQDQLSGLSTEDAEDLTDPDRKGTGGLNEGALEKAEKSAQHNQDPYQNQIANDMPEVDADKVHAAKTDDGVADSLEESSTASYMGMLLGESDDENGAGNNDTVVDDSDISDEGDEDEDMADFDEDSFLSDLNDL